MKKFLRKRCRNVLFAFVLMILSMCVEIDAAEVSQESLDVQVTIEAPNIWMNEDVLAIVSAVTTVEGKEIVKVEARAGKDGDWQDITKEMSFFIGENCLVYVRATDDTNATYIKTKQISHIDKEPPEANAFIQGDTLVVEAKDALSGIASVTVNGKQFNNLTDGKLALSLEDYQETQDGQIYVQAYDAAGNSSVSYTIPINPAPEPSVVPSEEPDSVTPIEGSASVMENSVKQTGEREFYTMSTEGGKNFYIVVDKEKTGDNVYVLVDASESDMMQIANSNKDSPILPEGDENGINEQINARLEEFLNKESEPEEEPAEPSPEPTPEVAAETKTGGSGGLIFIVLLAAGVGGAGYYFKIYRPQHEGGGTEDEEDVSESEKENEIVFEEKEESQTGKDEENN